MFINIPETPWTYGAQVYAGKTPKGFVAFATLISRASAFDGLFWFGKCPDFPTVKPRFARITVPARE